MTPCVLDCGRVRNSIVCLAEKSAKGFRNLSKITKRIDLFKKSRKPSFFDDETKCNGKLKFTNIMVSFLEVKLFEINITKELLDQIEQQYDIRHIDTVVIEHCSFHVSSEEFSDFLRKLKLKTLELLKVTFEPSFLTNELIGLASQKVLISSKAFIQCPNVTVDLLKDWTENPESLLRNLELRRIKTGIKFAEMWSNVKVIKETTLCDINWALGFDYYCSEAEPVLLDINRTSCLLSVTDEDNMRKYEIEFNKTAKVAGILQKNRIQFAFWMKEERSQ